MRLIFFSLFWPVCLFAQGSLPADAVLKPTFMTGFDSFSGGTAFVCRLNDPEETVILTAHHLFGPACGWEKEFRWDELKQEFEAMTALSMNDFRKWVTSTELVEIPGAEGWNEKGYHRDIAAWRFPKSNKLPSLPLAAKLPEKGESVFLFARERGKEDLELFEAVVETATDTEFTYRYKRADKVNFSGTSGAPVLDSEGHVVAINLGGFDEEGAPTLGVGNPLPSILKMLKPALERRPSK